MSVISIRALKLSAIVPRILNKKEAFAGRILGLCSSSLFIFDEHFLWHSFQSDIFQGGRTQFSSALASIFCKSQD